MPFIEDQLRRAIDETAASGLDWCVTLESKSAPENWVQLTWDHVNLHYPFADDPVVRLAGIGWPMDSLDLESWEANTFVTFSHAADDSLPDVAAFVRRYVETLLQQSTLIEDWAIDEHEI